MIASFLRSSSFSAFRAIRFIGLSPAVVVLSNVWSGLRLGLSRELFLWSRIFLEMLRRFCLGSFLAFLGRAGGVLFGFAGSLLLTQLC